MNLSDKETTTESNRIETDGATWKNILVFALAATIFVLNILW